MKQAEQREGRALSRADRTPVSQVMTRKVICAREEEDLGTLSRRFLELGISGAPVVDRAGRPVGVVSKTDLVRHAFERTTRSGHKVASQGPKNDSSPLEAKAEEPTKAIRVRDIMTPLAYTLRPDVSIARAAALMAFEGIHRLPIISEPGGDLVGILSAVDILRWMGEEDGYLQQSSDEGEAAVA